MSWTILSTPGTKAIYGEEGILVSFADQSGINGISDNQGDTEISLDSSLNLQPGDLAYLSFLEEEDFVDTPVRKVLRIATGGEPVFDVDYSAGYSSNGLVRKTENQNFIIESGGSGQKKIRSTARLRANLSGRYNVNLSEYAKARLDFARNPGTGQQPHATSVTIYPEGAPGTSHTTAALKVIDDSGPQPTIAYQDARVMQTTLDPNDEYVIRRESEKDQVASIQQGNQSNELTLYMYAGKSYRVTFSYQFEDTKTNVQGGNNISYNTETSDGGQTITGVNVTANQATSSVLEIVEDDFGTITSFVLNLEVLEPLEMRPGCEGKKLIWWHPSGGWCAYIFSKQYTYGQPGGNVMEARKNRVEARPVAYEDSRNKYVLNARFESEEVMDYLNSVQDSTEAYLANDNLTEWERVYPESSDKGARTRQPYITAANQVVLELVGEYNKRINEG